MKPIDWDSLPEPRRVVTLDEILEMPVLPGPGSASPSAVPNPYDLSGGGSALVPGLGLAETLSWTTTTPRTRKPDGASARMNSGSFRNLSAVCCEPNWRQRRDGDHRSGAA